CPLSATLEELNGAFVLLRAGTRGEGSEIPALAGFRIHLARIKPILAGSEFSYHAGHLPPDHRGPPPAGGKNLEFQTVLWNKGSTSLAGMTGSGRQHARPSYPRRHGRIGRRQDHDLEAARRGSALSAPRRRRSPSPAE